MRKNERETPKKTVAHHVPWFVRGVEFVRRCIVVVVLSEMFVNKRKVGSLS